MSARAGAKFDSEVKSDHSLESTVGSRGSTIATISYSNMAPSHDSYRSSGEYDLVWFDIDFHKFLAWVCNSF